MLQKQIRKRDVECSWPTNANEVIVSDVDANILLLRKSKN